MPSKNKTPLGLNQWEGTERPERTDFNSDNLLVDTILQQKANLDATGKLDSHLLYRGFCYHANEAVKPGIYYFHADCTDMPFAFGIMEVKTQIGDDYHGLSSGNDWMWQIAHSTQDGQIAVRSVINGLQFSNWVILATATPPQEFDLPLAKGYETRNVNSFYSKDQFGRTLVSFKVANTAGIAAEIVTIATLPKGYWPKIPVHNICSIADFSGRFFPFFVDEFGEVRVVVNNAIPPSEYCGFAGSISFDAQ